MPKLRTSWRRWSVFLWIFIWCWRPCILAGNRCRWRKRGIRNPWLFCLWNIVGLLIDLWFVHTTCRSISVGLTGRSSRIGWLSIFSSPWFLLCRQNGCTPRGWCICFSWVRLDPTWSSQRRLRIGSDCRWRRIDACWFWSIPWSCAHLLPGSQILWR